MRRHTLGGQSSWKFSKTNTFCGSMFEVYSALETGRRRTMEDECVVVHDLNAEFGLDTALYPPQALFALYDGHAGRGAVDFAVQHMNRLLLAATANDARSLPRSNSSCSSGSSISLSARRMRRSSTRRRSTTTARRQSRRKRRAAAAAPATRCCWCGRRWRCARRFCTATSSFASRRARTAT
jgi:hypothetical protein